MINTDNKARIIGEVVNLQRLKEIILLQGNGMSMNAVLEEITNMFGRVIEETERTLVEDATDFKQQAIEFLKESNAIEGVYDEDSLSQAQYAWDFLVREKELTMGVILKTHKILMLHQSLRPNEKGYFRKEPVYIGGKEAMNHILIEEKLSALLKEMNENPEDWKEHHIRYEEIHPFIDGNGRTGRMFMNWQRLQAGLPLLVIHEGDEQMEYYKWFQNSHE